MADDDVEPQPDEDEAAEPESGAPEHHPILEPEDPEDRIPPREVPDEAAALRSQARELRRQTLKIKLISRRRISLLKRRHPDWFPEQL